MIKEAIKKLVEKKLCDFKTLKQTFLEIFENKASDFEISAFLVALRMKEESAQDIYAAASVIRKKAVKIKVKGDILDTCGTGGSGIGKFNISTTVAFIAAAAGFKVAKHGNRSITSSCGSADLLESLGINIFAPSQLMQESLEKIGIAFLFAPLYHPAFKNVAHIRKGLGIKTIFNIVGPLCNPAQATHQLLGVSHPDLLYKTSYALKKLGIKKAAVVYSPDLKDEVSLKEPTEVIFVDKKGMKKRKILPSQFGLKKYSAKRLKVKDKDESVKIFLSIIEGKDSPYYEAVLANASLCFYLLGKVRSLKEGVRLADSLIKEGKVKKKFLEFRDFLKR